ncbi:hypothetical protein F3Y22_tig00110597pilonHSYRG01152 [Hibiscus syriacus]|uniref:MULE transposase domain-containing protein n=1 Tax=Hibiscus syriacus TaxID=106335 RepID=A0A6A3A4I2_HIBSY|nr:hypothetical protein F3Y22_tig00110597pilonHSYRG01152 [Hibiscus syriacus]
MLNYWVKYGFIDIYVEHELDTPEIVDDILLLNIGEGNDKGDCNTEITVAGKGNDKGDCTTEMPITGEADDMSDSEDVAADKDVAAASEHEESDSGEDNAHYINVPYLSDGQDDDELQSARENIIGKEQVEVNTDFENKTATEIEIHEETEDGGGNIGVTEGVGGVETDYYDSDDHWSLIGAKNLVTSRLARNCKEEFAQLWDYTDELKAKKLRSTIKMAVNRVSDNSPPYFKRFYICFNAMKRCWKEGCRPILGVDGCFLKGPFKGILLSVVGRDVNDQMYPIAWVVVEGKNNLFLVLGIEISVNDVLPQEDIEIVLDKCLRIGLEVKRTKAYQFSFWQIVKSSTEIKGQKNKDALSKIDGTVATEMFSKKEKMWTKAFQKLHAKSDIVDNDLCEAFNSSIVESRYKSIITMLEEIRVKIMTRIVEKRRFLAT